MKLKGRDSDAWHKRINDTVGLRRPTDADFPWIALQNHTGYYLKKKGKLSPTQIDERLFALIQNHPSKEAAFAACAHTMSVRTISDWLVNGSSVEPESSLGTQKYLQVIVAINRVNPAAVSAVEAQWACCLLEHATSRGSSRSLAQQLQDVLPLLPAHVAPNLLLQDEIQKLANKLCREFAEQLQDLSHTNQWMDAHFASHWLSTSSNCSDTK